MQTMRLVEGYNPPSRFRPGTLGLTLMTTGLFVSGLFFLNPKLARVIDPPLIVRTIPLDPPPPIDKPVEHKQVPQKVSPYVAPKDPVVTLPDNPHVDWSPPPTDPGIPETAGTATVTEPIKHDPIIVGAKI